MSVRVPLGRADRIASVAGGIGLIAFPFIGDIDNVVLQVAVALFGVALLVVGGLGGT